MFSSYLIFLALFTFLFILFLTYFSFQMLSALPLIAILALMHLWDDMKKIIGISFEFMHSLFSYFKSYEILFITIHLCLFFLLLAMERHRNFYVKYIHSMLSRIKYFI